MIRFFFLLGILVSASVVCGQSPAPYGALPSPSQLKWHEMEMYALIHFGVDTYTDKEWGYGDEDPALVNPVSFSAEQIVAAAKAGGMKGVIVVAKHHDGLCLWPTKTTTHNISKSPWKDGKGDILKEYQLACRKLEMKLGVYCSPWDRNDPRYGTREYVMTYRQQLEELYTGYGPLFMSWHDGANGGDGYYGGTREKRQIDRSTYYGWDTIFAQVRKHQPSAVIFGDVGPDVRWVGNEEGYAGVTCWATYTPESTEEGKRPANGLSKYWLGTEGTLNGKYWMPAECDVPLRPGWFYHASQDGQVKSPYTLLDLYYKSVGRGANLDLGLAPDRTGRLHPNDVKSLRGFGDLLTVIFRKNLVTGSSFKASNVRGKDLKKFGPKLLSDQDRYSYWATDDSVMMPQLLITLPAKSTFNVIRLRENIKLGQRITSFAIDAFENNKWKEITTGTSIGANRLVRLPQNITTGAVRLRITSSLASPALSDFGLFREPPHLSLPEIGRNREGMVEIGTAAPVEGLYYTTDGSEPTKTSTRYSGPFLMELGGTIKARAYDRGNLSGEIATRRFGLATKNWKLLPGGSPDNAGRLMDGNPGSIFTASGRDSAGGSSVLVDLGGTMQLTGFSYLPRQDNKNEGTVNRYQFWVSEDGITWKVVMEGEFANIASNPVEQVIQFNTAVTAAYIKLTALSFITGSRLTAAELGVFVK